MIWCEPSHHQDKYNVILVLRKAMIPFQMDSSQIEFAIRFVLSQYNSTKPVLLILHNNNIQKTVIIVKIVAIIAFKRTSVVQRS